MNATLAVGLGGFIGSIARYRLGGLVLHHSLGSRFPGATLVVNLAGCLLVGLLAGWAEHRNAPGPGMRLLLITGFCGGFTTFSAFGLETLYLMRRDAFALAALNVALSVAGGIAGVWIGWKVAHG
jgi:CrcB protein